MSIESEISAAIDFYNQGNYQESLIFTLLAISASSRKQFPKGTKSFRKPKEKMGDGEAFVRFLSPIFARFVLQNDRVIGEDCAFMITINNESIQFTQFIYDIRCSLIHVAELPDNISFATLNIKNRLRKKYISIDKDATFGVKVIGKEKILSRVCINALIACVIYADINNDIYPQEQKEYKEREASFKKTIPKGCVPFPGRLNLIQGTVEFFSH